MTAGSLDSTFERDHAVLVFLCPAYFICPLGLSMLPQMTRFPPFHGREVFHDVCIPNSLYPLSMNGHFEVSSMSPTTVKDKNFSSASSDYLNSSQYQLLPGLLQYLSNSPHCFCYCFPINYPTLPFFGNSVLPCGPGWPQTLHLSVSVSKALELQVHAITPSHINYYYYQKVDSVILLFKSH
jgi:hypothetical protein